MYTKKYISLVLFFLMPSLIFPEGSHDSDINQPDKHATVRLDDDESFALKFPEVKTNTKLEATEKFNIDELGIEIVTDKIVYLDMIKAIKTNDLEKFRENLIEHPEVTDDKFALMYLLLIAAASGSRDLVEEIKPLQVTLDSLNKKNQSIFANLDLIYISIRKNNLLLLQTLLDAGFSPNGAKPRTNISSFDKMARVRPTLLCIKSNQKYIWHQGDPWRLECPWTSGCPWGPTFSDLKFEMTPLIFAIEKDNNEAAMILIKTENIVLDLATSHKSGAHTALMVAAYKGNEKIVKALLKAGAHKGIRNINGAIAIDYAAYQNYSEIIKILSKTYAEHLTKTPAETTFTETVTVTEQHNTAAAIVYTGLVLGTIGIIGIIGILALTNAINKHDKNERDRNEKNK